MKNSDYLSLLISAPQGGGGKTLVSLGLARALSRQGFAVKAFKKGPDYIDAAWLARATGMPATNLDPFLLPKKAIKDLFTHAMAEHSSTEKPLFALIEGNRGLYDGVDREGTCSTAELARTLDCPVLLVINCTKMTRTVAALVLGLTRFEPETAFAGILLNNIGTRRQKKLLTDVLGDNCDIPVIGALPRLSQNPLPERHMGIASSGPALAGDTGERLDAMADLIVDNCDISLLLARSAKKTRPSPQRLEVVTGKVTLGFVLDRAFWFYYEENLDALRRAGANLVPLSITENTDVDWTSLDGLYIGGGFPEDHAETLARSPHLAQIREMAKSGLPIYAECGGFMLLSRSLACHGASYPMAGIFAADVTFCERPQGLGYTEGTVLTDTPFYPCGTHIAGHEFHYSRVTQSSETCVMQLAKGVGMGLEQGKHVDGFSRFSVWASYTHIFAPALPGWARRFVELAVTGRRAR